MDTERKVDVVASSVDLRFGDCLDLLPAIPDQSVDMILADLPYGTTRNKWDCQIDLQRLWPEYMRVCRGAIVLTAQSPFDKVLGASNLPMLRYEWIWEKTNATGHMNAKKCPMKAHENVLVFYKHLRTYNPQKTTGHVRKTATADRSRLQSDNYGRQDGVTVYDSTERYPRSVITFPSDKQRSKLHPTQKPLSLMSYFVLTYTNPGDTVLDNCYGSGTVGVSCVELGRNFIGMEKDPEHFCTGAHRINAALSRLGVSV